MDELPDALLDHILELVPARSARVLPLLLGRGLIVASRGAVEQVCLRWRARALALAPRVEVEVAMIQRRLVNYVLRRRHAPSAMCAAGVPEEVQEAVRASYVTYGQLLDLPPQQRLESQQVAQPWEAALAAWLVAQLHGRTPAVVCFNGDRAWLVHIWRFLAEALLPTAARLEFLQVQPVAVLAMLPALPRCTQLRKLVFRNAADSDCYGNNRPEVLPALLRALPGLHSIDLQLPGHFEPLGEQSQMLGSILEAMAALPQLESISLQQEYEDWPPDVWQQVLELAHAGPGSPVLQRLSLLRFGGGELPQELADLPATVAVDVGAECSPPLPWEDDNTLDPSGMAVLSHLCSPVGLHLFAADVPLHLWDCPHLTSLTAMCCKLGCTAAWHVLHTSDFTRIGTGSLSSLQRLELFRGKVHLPALAAMAALTSLWLEEVVWTDEQLITRWDVSPSLPSELTLLRNLRALSIKGYELDSSALALLDQLTSVQELQLKGCRCTAVDLPLLTHLTALDLEEAAFGEHSLPSSFPSMLRALRRSLPPVDIEPDPDAVLARLIDLQHLEVLSLAFPALKSLNYPDLEAWSQFDAADDQEEATLDLKHAAAAAGLRFHVGASLHAPAPFTITVE